MKHRLDGSPYAVVCIMFRFNPKTKLKDLLLCMKIVDYTNEKRMNKPFLEMISLLLLLLSGIYECIFFSITTELI